MITASYSGGNVAITSMALSDLKTTGPVWYGKEEFRALIDLIGLLADNYCSGSL